jgi:hypothetical protein
LDPDERLIHLSRRKRITYEAWQTLMTHYRAAITFVS